MKIMMMMFRIVVRLHVFILLLCWVRNIHILSVSIIDDSNNNNNDNSVNRNDATNISVELSDTDILSDDNEYRSSSSSYNDLIIKDTYDNNYVDHQHRNRVTAANNNILNLDKTTINMLANAAIIKMLEDHNDFDFDELDSSKQIELLNYIRQILSTYSSSEEINSSSKIKSKSDVDDADDDDDRMNDVVISDDNAYDFNTNESSDDVNGDDNRNDLSDCSLIEDDNKDVTDDINVNHQHHNSEDNNSTLTTTVNVDDDNSNNSIWELLKQQIKSDFAPFLVLIPRPIKIFISTQFNNTYRSLKIITYSAVQPLFVVLNKYILLFGMKLFHLTKQFNVLLNKNVNKTRNNNDIIIYDKVDDTVDGIDNSNKGADAKKDKVVDDGDDDGDSSSKSIDATRDLIRVASIDDNLSVSEILVSRVMDESVEEVYGELVEI